MAEPSGINRNPRVNRWGSDFLTGAGNNQKQQLRNCNRRHLNRRLMQGHAGDMHAEAAFPYEGT
ncbi:MAG: hypothetical protein JWP44_4441 [Mucilaginibacter sp.]|nr:hypothetical protein [Mucilaginibacter sp.]